MHVVKAITALLVVELKIAKEMADAAPTVIKESIPKDEAEAIKKSLEQAGAEVVLLPR